MVHEDRMGGVDGGGVHREAAELARDPLEGYDDGIGGRWRREELIGLDVERRKYCGEQASLNDFGND